MIETTSQTGGTPRIATFDHVRAIAVLAMIVSHVTVMFGTANACMTPIGRFMNEFCGTAPAAPVFMILMGIFFIYPHDKSFSQKMARGAKLFVLDILLNVIRMVIPWYLLSLYAPAEVEKIASMLQVGRDELYARGLYNMDILGFAGVAFMLLALLQLALTRVWQWVGIGLLVAVVAPWFWGAAEGLGRWFYLVQPLWGRALVENVPTDTAFPAFPWLVYPLTGLIIGLSMRSGTTENQLRPGMTAAGSVLLVSGLIIVQIWGQTQYGDYYRMPVGGTFVYLGFALLWISSFLWLSKYGLGQKPLSALSFWSEHITLVYCVQWFLFGFSVLFLRFRTVDSLLVLVALIPVFLGLTWAISRLLLRSARFMHVFRWFSR